MNRDPRQTGAREFWGMALLTLGALLLLALSSYHWEDVSALKMPPREPPLNFIGPAGAWFAYAALLTLGVGAYALPIGCALGGVVLLFRPAPPLWRWALWWAILAVAGCGLFQLHPAGVAALCERWNLRGLAGGLCGWGLAEAGLARGLGATGATILLLGVVAAAALVLIGREGLVNGTRRALAFARWAGERLEAWRAARRDRTEQIAREERELTRQIACREKELKQDERLAAALKPGAGKPAPPPPNPFVMSDADPPVSPPPKPAPRPREPKPARAETPRTPAPAPTPALAAAPYQLPPVSLLQEASADKAILSDHDTVARVIKETLAMFDVPCEVTNIEQGPTVTQYELLPAPGVRLEKITQLQSNLALTLKATTIRIQAPIPGKGVVGIEVPNSVSTKVYLREIIEGEAWQTSKAAIPLVLGKDVGGNDLIADLATMPHLLIAGATGSGKTVCMNTILAGMLMARAPDQLKLMLVDPKRVEFAAYNHLPHLVVPVIVESKKVSHGLRWAIIEMDKRYKLFARVGVRNIQGYNKRPPPAAPETPILTEGEPEEPLPPTLPYIVIVIDELADLMLEAKAEIENYITRLAQMSRAVGIHMILATQRPSVNVITGTIKANFPARISFQVAQKVDSRTILDTSGADKLLGRGDMLILPPGSAKLIRAQGAMTTDEDIFALVQHIKAQAQPSYEQTLKASIEGSSSASPFEEEDAEDDLLEPAIAIIRQERRASTSLLQRRMSIGYNRAGRLMDALEQRGIVGPQRGSDPREILIDLDGEIPSNAPDAAEPSS